MRRGATRSRFLTPPTGGCSRRGRCRRRPSPEGTTALPVSSLGDGLDGVYGLPEAAGGVVGAGVGSGTSELPCDGVGVAVASVIVTAGAGSCWGAVVAEGGPLTCWTQAATSKRGATIQITRVLGTIPTRASRFSPDPPLNPLDETRPPQVCAGPNLTSWRPCATTMYSLLKRYCFSEPRVGSRGYEIENGE